jgi:hypothetical protein
VGQVNSKAVIDEEPMKRLRLFQRVCTQTSSHERWLGGSWSPLRISQCQLHPRLALFLSIQRPWAWVLSTGHRERPSQGACSDCTRTTRI